MKTFSSPGVCLIAALAPGCTSDSSQFRAFRDGAVEHPAAADVGATGAGGTASLPDAAAATGGSGTAHLGRCTRRSDRARSWEDLNGGEGYRAFLGVDGRGRPSHMLTGFLEELWLVELLLT